MLVAYRELPAGGSWEAALVLLSAEPKPHLAVCNAALSACGNHGHWQTLGGPWNLLVF